MSVYPSAGDFATASAAIMPLAPGRFSTTTDCPRASVSFCAMILAATSVPAAAGKADEHLPRPIGIGAALRMAVERGQAGRENNTEQDAQRTRQCASLYRGVASALRLVVERERVELEPAIDQPVTQAPRHLGLQPFDILRLELDHFAVAQVDEVVVVAVGYLLVTRAAIAKIMALDDAGILEQLHSSIDGGDGDAVVNGGATPIELLDVRVVICGRQHACDDPALLGHAHALGRAYSFDVSRLRRAHDASPSDRNIMTRGVESIGPGPQSSGVRSRPRSVRRLSFEHRSYHTRSRRRISAAEPWPAG